MTPSWGGLLTALIWGRSNSSYFWLQTPTSAAGDGRSSSLGASVHNRSVLYSSWADRHHGFNAINPFCLWKQHTSIICVTEEAISKTLDGPIGAFMLLMSTECCGNTFLSAHARYWTSERLLGHDDPLVTLLGWILREWKQSPDFLSSFLYLEAFNISWHYLLWSSDPLFFIHICIPSSSYLFASV